MLEIFEKSLCEDKLSTEKKHRKEKRERKTIDLEKVIEEKNQSEIVKTVVTEEKGGKFTPTNIKKEFNNFE
jgi:hypothetical protein